MKKPCDDCNVSIEQYVENGEVTCYQTCNKFKDWQEEQEKGKQSEAKRELVK